MESKKYKLGVYIGRFQPFHKGHLETVLKAANECDILAIVLGSSKSTKTIKNPFTWIERQQTIEKVLTEYPELKNRVAILKARDYPYNDRRWVQQIQFLVSASFGDLKSKEIALVGVDKDESTYYLKELFPQWSKLLYTKETEIDATYIREAIYRYGLDHVKNQLKDKLPKQTLTFLETYNFEDLSQHWAHIQAYKASPYGQIPVSVAVDALITHNDSILLIKRGSEYGHGLLALPGGHLEPSETLLDGCLRELNEETGITSTISNEMLKKCIVKVNTYDSPTRSLRNRIITQCYHFDLNGLKIPEIKANSDAKEALWLTVPEFFASMDKCHDDHFFIIEDMLGVYNDLK